VCLESKQSGSHRQSEGYSKHKEVGQQTDRSGIKNGIQQVHKDAFYEYSQCYLEI